MSEKKIPTPTIERLSIYLSCLKRLMEEKVRTVASQRIAERTGRNAAQVRKDLSFFGEFGVPGVGYNVAQLKERLTDILGLRKGRKAILVGAGNLGTALCGYKGFREEGFDICALFDNDEAKVGKKIAGIEVVHISELGDMNREIEADIGIIAVPAFAAQRVASALVEAGIASILNFAPTSIETPPGVSVRNVDLTRELMVLSCYMAFLEGRKEVES